MTNEDKLTTVLLAGELLLINGAEIYRVEETVERMGRCAGFSEMEAFATPTGLFVSAVTSEGRVLTRVRRIRQMENNLSIIASVNQVSRKLAADHNLAGAAAELERLTSPRRLAGRVAVAAAFFGSASFAMMFGGDWWEAVASGGIGSVIFLGQYLLRELRMSRFLTTVLAALLAAVLGQALGGLVSIRQEIVILAGVMVLVPGLAMTTAIRDMLSGELVSGVARGAEAMVIAVAVAVGVAVALGLGG